MDGTDGYFYVFATITPRQPGIFPSNFYDDVTNGITRLNARTIGYLCKLNGNDTVEVLSSYEFVPGERDSNNASAWDAFVDTFYVGELFRSRIDKLKDNFFVIFSEDNLTVFRLFKINEDKTITVSPYTYFIDEYPASELPYFDGGADFVMESGLVGNKLVISCVNKLLKKYGNWYSG